MAELWTFTRLDVIAFGCLLAIASRSDVWRHRLDAVAGSTWGAFIAFGVLCLSLVLSQFSWKFVVGIAYTVNAASIAILVWHVVQGGNQRLRKVFNSRPVVFVGTLSYSLYLWQQLFLNPHSEAAFCRFPLNIVLAVAVACASYYLIEQPALKWRAALERRSTYLPAPA